jgi:UDP-glucose 4-epimerase
LAASASVEHGVGDWLGTHRVNLTGTITLFEAIRRRTRLEPIPVVYASSAAVYGDCKRLPIIEDAEKLPLSAYGADKYACELHARVATHVHGIPTTGLRFFNVYGPRQDPTSPYSGVISIFCDRLRRGEALLVNGDGHLTRDFIFVSDIVAALLRAMQLNLAGAPSFNCCTGIATSVLELARLAAEIFGRDLNVCFAAHRSGEIRHSLGSPASSWAVFDLPEPVTLRAGLAKLLA